MKNDLKGNENYFELTGGSSYGGFELPGVDCTWKEKKCWLGLEVDAPTLMANNFAILVKN